MLVSGVPVNQLSLVVLHLLLLGCADQVQPACLHERSLVVEGALFQGHVLLGHVVDEHGVSVHLASALRALDATCRAADFVCGMCRLIVSPLPVVVSEVALLRVRVDGFLGAPALQPRDGQALMQVLGLARDS